MIGLNKNKHTLIQFYNLNLNKPENKIKVCLQHKHMRKHATVIELYKKNKIIREERNKKSELQAETLIVKMEIRRSGL